MRYTVKELDIPENQQQEENTDDRALLSGRKLMEQRFQVETSESELDNDAMAKNSITKSSKVVKVSFDDEHFVFCGRMACGRRMSRMELSFKRALMAYKLKEEVSKKKTKKTAAATKENDGLLFDFISIGEDTTP